MIPNGQSTSWATLSVRYSQSIRFAWAVPEGIKASLTGQALVETSDRSIEDTVVIPTTLAAAKALASLGLYPRA